LRYAEQKGVLMRQPIRKNHTRTMRFDEYYIFLRDTHEHMKSQLDKLSDRQKEHLYCQVILETEPPADSISYEDKKNAWEAFTEDLKHSLKV